MTTTNFADWSKEIYDVIYASSSLTTLMTGGIYQYRDLPESFNRSTVPTAYDTTTRLLKPLAVVKGRDAISLFAPRSQNPNNRFTPMMQTIEIWFYDKAAANWDTLNSAAAIVFGLLDQKRVSQTFNIEFRNQINSMRESKITDASFLLHEYTVIGRI